MRHWRHLSRGLVTGTALFAALASVAPVVAVSALGATLNLAQSDRVIMPAPADVRRLAAYFSPPYHTGPLPPVVGELLLRDAPAELRTGCAAMVDNWGTAARGSSRVTVRILAVAGGNAWLAYRCDSRSARFDHDYTERLAVFTAARGNIQFLDLKAATDTRATLYHVSLAETLKLRGAENSAAFEVFAIGSGSSAASNGDAQVPPAPSRAAPVPNARGGAREPENRLVIVANSAIAAKVVLAQVTARQVPHARVGNSSGADADDEYRAALRFDHDVSGHVIGVAAYYRDQSAGPRPHFGTLRYVWDRAAFTFAIARPIRLPPVPRERALAN